MRVAAGVLLAAAMGVAQEAPPRKPVVLGYYPSWTSRLKPAAIRVERFTHLAHAFLQAEPDGTLKEDPAIPGAAFAKAARDGGAVPLLSLGGARSAATFRAIVSDPAALRRFVQAVADAVRDFKYGGVDLDWEPTEGEADRVGLAALVKALREAMPRGFLSAAAPPSAWYGKWWDVDAVRERLDLLNVMAYDFYGPWSPDSGHPSAWRAASDDRDAAPLCGEAAVAYWTRSRGWPPSRLALGIPCYGRAFAVRRWGQKPTGRPLMPEVPWHESKRRLAGPDWLRTWSDETEAPTLVRRDGEELVGCDDPESGARKGRKARELGLGGIFFWHIEQDFVDGDHELVKAASAAFNPRVGR